MSKELGTLVVVVLKARNLPDDHFYKQDVYTKVTLQGTTKKTKVDVKGGQHPEWDAELRFTVTDQDTANSRKLEISCWSKEPRQDGMVGKGELDISETLRTGEFDDWVPLSTDKGQRGDIYLEMTWFAAGPPPSLSRRPSKLKPADRLSRPSHAYQSSLAPIPSSPPQKNGKLTSPDTRRTSPKGDLPPLPEENGPPPPEALPSILRPGAGRPRPASTSPHAHPTEAQGSTAYPPHRSSLPHDQVGGIPGLLRAGPPNGIPPAHTAPVKDADVPYLSASTLGQVSPPRTVSPPGSCYPPHSITPQPAHNVQAPYTQPSGYQPSHTPQPPYVPPANTTPAPSYIPATTPVPQVTYHNPSPPPVAPPYGPQPTPIPQSPPYGPQQPSGHVHHSSQSAIYPSQSPAPNTVPGFTLPLWGNQPTQPPPPSNGYNVAPSYPGYGYPPGPPPPQAYYAPPPTARPYPYNYPPPLPRESDFEGPPDPAKAARYQKPLPLPDDGIPPPTHTRSPPPAAAPSQPQPQSQAHPHPKPTRSTTLEDHEIALRLQQEEEERQKTQEELDEELARKLDLELNLASESNDPLPAAAEPVASLPPLRQNSDSVPGQWYRHRA